MDGKGAMWLHKIPEGKGREGKGAMVMVRVRVLTKLRYSKKTVITFDVTQQQGGMSVV